MVVEAMGVEEWGVHMRAHFKDEGYWVCGGRESVCSRGEDVGWRSVGGCIVSGGGLRVMQWD